MPARTAPTGRQRRLGTELRKLREKAGLTVADAARELAVGRTLISNSEAGRTGLSPDRVRHFASIYECDDQAYMDALAAMAAERGRGWWDEYRGIIAGGGLDLAELESHATALRAAQMMHFPGLLQTEDYAKAVFSTAVPVPTSVELRRRLSLRMRRRDVLDKEHAPLCTFLIHEAALRITFGNAAVMKAQLGHLLEAMDRDNVTVRVIPFSAGGFPNTGTSTLYASGPVPQLDTVQLDVASGATMLDADAVLAKYRRVLDRTEQVSLTVASTRQLIQSARKDL